MRKLIKNISKHKYLIAAAGYTLWLTAVSLTPLEGIELPSFRMADKIVHFFLYFFFVILWLKASTYFSHHLIYLLIIAVIWGIVIEFLQEYFIPTRSGDVYDALANTLGAISAAGFYRYYKGRFFK